MIHALDPHNVVALIDPDAVMHVRVASGYDPEDMFAVSCMATTRDGLAWRLFNLEDNDTPSDALARAMRILGRKVTVRPP